MRAVNAAMKSRFLSPRVFQSYTVLSVELLEVQLMIGNDLR